MAGHPRIPASPSRESRDSRESRVRGSNSPLAGLLPSGIPTSSRTGSGQSRSRAEGAQYRGSKKQRSVRSGSRRSGESQSVKVGPLILLIGSALFLMGSILVVGANVARWFQPEPVVPEPISNLKVRLDQPILAFPEERTSNRVSSIASATEAPVLNQSTARDLIETWLQAKAAAMSSTYNLEPLTTILTGEALLRRQQEAEAARREGFYAEYNHAVEIESIEILSDPGAPQDPFTETAEPTPNPETPPGESDRFSTLTEPSPLPEEGNTARITAIVDESATFYQNGILDEVSSYNAAGLRVQYELEQRNGEWRITDMNVLR